MVAGDTARVSPGNYGESVQTVANGTAGSRITFRATPANDPSNQVITKQFRVKNRFITIEGFNITGATDLNNASIRVEPPGTYNGSDCLITNNTIRDTPFVISSNASFGNNFIHVTDGNFSSAGFTAGSLVYLGADSLSVYTNHGTAHTVQGISPDGRTMYFTDTLANDPGTNYWAVVVPGTDNSTFKGILCPFGSGVGASNVVVANNTLSNLFGPALIFTGNHNLIRGNTFTRLHGQYAMQIQGPNAIIDHNLIYNSPNIEWFTHDELVGAEHPLGGTYYDWQCNVTASFANNVTNVLFAYNWLQNCDNQLTQIEDASGSHGYQIVSNVFVGMMSHGSFSRNSLTFDHNTFYRCAYNIDENTPLGIGGVGGGIQSGLTITKNVFVDNGEHASVYNEAPWSLIDSANYTISSNYSVSAETTGWAPTVATFGVLSISGDPGFVNARNPLGPDGLPFTADDGLRPLPNSPLAILGLGALAPMPATSPIAHFTVKLANPGWKDATGTNYNPAWGALKPHQRSGVIRPFNTPEALGQIPLRVVFDGRETIDGTGMQNHAILTYAWDFGDGAKCITHLPVVCHTYTTTGTNWVTLSVTNVYGVSSVYSNAYRTLPGGSGIIRYVAMTGNDATGNGSEGAPWRTIQRAASAAAPGWTISVGPGSYGEIVDCRQAAAPNGRITFIGHGSRTAGFNLRNADYTVEGFDLDGKPAPPALIYVYSTAHRIWAWNNYLHNVTNIYGVWMNSSGNYPQDGPSSCAFSNNVFNGIQGPSIVLSGSNNQAVGNIIKNTQSEGDAFRAWGAGHRIAYNYCTNLSAFGGGGHADFFQSFGPYPILRDIVIEGNIVLGNDCQVCMLEHDPNYPDPQDFSGVFTNIVFRNNIFANLLYAANVDVDGTKWYNNLFYRVNTANGGHVFAFGGNKGSSYGTVLKNNAFVACGNGTTIGWYPRVGDAGVSNWSLEADYNFVCQADYSAFPSAPPDSSYNFGSDGQDPHGVNGGDPGFRSTAKNDFGLRTDSLLVGRGANLSVLFGYDMAGNPRPAQGPWDIGPLQKDPGALPHVRPLPPSSLRVLAQ